jgi:two-component system cell cycle sensor histidine kinase/response regulator CckA
MTLDERFRHPSRVDDDVLGDKAVPSPLKVLIVEDVHDDALLTVRALRQQFGECEWRRVDTDSAIQEQLRTFTPHVAIADHNLPLLPGGAALAALLRESPETPVIIVTGSLHEEGAAEYIKNGAADFIVKNHLHRLGPAVQRALDLATERALRRHEQERQRAFFSASPLPMWVFDRDTLAFVDVNDAAIATYGYSRDEFLNRSLRDLLPADATPQLDDRIRASATGPQRVGVRKHLKKDGSEIEVDVVTTDLAIGGRDLRLSVLNDVTEPRRIAGEMEKSQRMEAIGRLAGGVAHDFNNMLTVIQSVSEILLDSLSADATSRADVELILGATREAAALTRQLLAFSRRQMLAPRVLDLNELIPETQKMLGRLLGTKIAVRAVLHPQLGFVRADAGQVQQILVNLAVNARDAMPAGGTITIETYNVGGGADAPGTRESVVLRVSDTGIGMDAATQARIFEPFFTTKERGRGTGLGLATVYGIVQQSGGYIRVMSAPNEGSSFMVILPRVRAPLESARATETSQVLARGKETVLVAEDDEAVRGTMVRILRGQGYEVITASNGSEAISVADRHEGTIDLLVSDVVMPGANGMEVARRVRAARPKIGVLLVSGDVDDDAVRAGAVESGEAMLEKPFGPPELARAVRAALDSR